MIDQPKKKQEHEQEEEQQTSDWQLPPTNLNQVAPRLDTFAPVPESDEERQRLEQELATLDAPEQQEGPASEDAQP